MLGDDCKHWSCETPSSGDNGFKTSLITAGIVLGGIVIMGLIVLAMKKLRLLRVCRAPVPEEELIAQMAPAPSDPVAAGPVASSSEPRTSTVTRRATYNRKKDCLLYTSPSPRDGLLSRMPSSA